MTEAVIVDAVRSPVGRGKVTGALAGVHPVDLLATVISALIERTGIDASLVDDVLIGCVSQSGEQASTPGRQAWLAAGLPVSVPSTTIERKCGSGQQAVDFAVQGIVSGAYDLVVAGGVEVMSRVPMGSALVGKDPFGPAVRRRFPDLTSQGVAAELVASAWNLSRTQLDEYSVRSHQLAAAATAAGAFDSEIVPIPTPGGLVRADETIRPTTTLSGLSALTPAFASEANVATRPGLDWKITAGNSSQIADGAGAMLLASTEAAKRLGLTPRARVHLSAVAADDPVMMLTAPIPATQKLLKRSGLNISDFDAIEVNEAFAPVPLAWNAEFGAPLERLNPRGGAIALGHPLGASGIRLMTTMLHHLEQTGGHRGLQTMCEAGGMANATMIEILG